MSRAAYSPPELSSWLTRWLRFVVFPVTPQVREPQQWWKELVGSEPDESVRRKDGLEEAGPLGNKKHLTLTIDPFRVQWSLEPLTTLVEAANAIPSLGNLVDEARTFAEVMFGWMKSAPPVKRIGFACGPMLPVATHRDGYRMLDRLLPSVEVDPDTTDFKYRVNRPTRSKVDGGTINQLAAWSAVQVNVQMNYPLPDRSERHTIGGDSCVALELDVNTHYERSEPFNSEQADAISRELVELALGRVAKGDVKE